MPHIYDIDAADFVRVCFMTYFLFVIFICYALLLFSPLTLSLSRILASSSGLVVILVGVVIALSRGFRRYFGTFSCSVRVVVARNCIFEAYLVYASVHVHGYVCLFPVENGICVFVCVCG